MKEKEVSFISLKLKKLFELLAEGKFEDKKLYELIWRAINDLNLNPMCGIKVPKYLWPQEYIKNYGVTNLWKYNLPDGWRLIYTIESDDVKIVSIILEWMTHKEYERRFGY